MMQEWLRTGRASWEGLCIALAKEFVDHINLAKQIAEKHRVPHHGAVADNLPFPIQSSGEMGTTKLLTGHSGKPSLNTANVHVGLDGGQNRSSLDGSNPKPAFSKPEMQQPSYPMGHETRSGTDSTSVPYDKTCHFESNN